VNVPEFEPEADGQCSPVLPFVFWQINFSAESLKDCSDPYSQRQEWVVQHFL
jgi:hypothetical protein